VTPALVAGVVTALLVSLAAQPIVVIWLVKHGLIDYPNRRSSHASPVPRGGGLGIVAGASIGLGVSIVAGASPPESYVLLVIAILVLCFAVVGFLDDRWTLAAGARLATQFALASLVILTLSENLGDPPVDPVAGLAAAIGGVVWIAAYTNAFNFMDGINGIATLHAVVASAFFAVIGAREGLTEISLLAGAVTGASLGFIPWNTPQARVFMGDVGSYALGSVLASISLWLWWEGVEPVLCIAPLAVFMADTGWALIRRLVGNRSWREAHREHVYQQLVDCGWGQARSAGFATVVAVIACGLALLADSGAHVVGIGALLVLLAGYLASPWLVLHRSSGVLEDAR